MGRGRLLLLERAIEQAWHEGAKRNCDEAVERSIAPEEHAGLAPRGGPAGINLLDREAVFLPLEAS